MKLITIFTLGAAMAAQGGWVELFNGKDFANFGGAEKTELNGYLVKDGMIESTPKCRNLVTEKDYADYILEFEFQLTPGANNGLGIHYPGTGDAAYAGMELQILDGEDKKWEGKLKDYQHHGSLYSLVPALRGHMKPAGEWNAQRVTVRGPRVAVELNGVCILDANLDEVNKSHPKHEGAKRRSGKICFAGHGDVIRVRKMRIAEIPFGEDAAGDEYLPAGKADPRFLEDGYTALFDGKSLEGWVQADGHAGHWIPKDGWILHYDGKSEARDKNLWTEKEYTDFTMVCDWRWTGPAKVMGRPILLPNGLTRTGPGGKPVTVDIKEYDSGVFVRGAVRTQVNLWNWPVGSGEVYGIRNDRNQPLPIRAALTPRVNADMPVGEWNRFVITVQGEKLTVYLNGKCVLFEAVLPGVKPSGRLALQHHGNALEFANLYVKEL
ncbi:MAG: DUF1080 domain-containing protein [Akkermansiaceae bacterium]|nr:DUF1080 domain-containing protein [Akkermansiaceae bacterium]